MKTAKVKTAKAIDNFNEISPSELYKQIKNQEEHLSKAGFKWLETQFANQRFFTRPLFNPLGSLSDDPSELLSYAGVKYNHLLQLLRQYQTREDRLFIIATWLRLEGICHPEDLLGKEFSQYRRKALRGPHGRLSLTDVRQAFIVDNWEPYFERLLLAQRKGLNLRQLGFEERAIQSAFRKRSPVAAACEYVSSRLGLDPEALANAYCRTISRAKKMIANSSNP